MSDTFSTSAPAKVNLALSVGPLDQASGMHRICSWMVTVDFCDDLELTRLESGRLSRYAVLWHDDAPVKSDIDWSIQHDLAVRAHLALERHVGRALPVQLALRKRIPVGGGLGGGSSNAAAMLRACRALFNLHDEVDPGTLLKLAANLGSDVPFLLHGGSAIVEGTGEELHHFNELPPLYLVLVLVEASCNTGAIYARFDDDSGSSLRPDAVRSLAAGSGEPFNDLAGSAKTHAPVLGELIEGIEAACACDVHITGSGSSLFIICDSGVEAASTATTISELFDVRTLAVEAHASFLVIRDDHAMKTYPIDTTFAPIDLDGGDWSAVEPLYQALLQRPLDSPAALEQLLIDRSELDATVGEARANRYIEMTRHTDDEVATKAYLFFVEEMDPKLKDISFQLDRHIVRCEHVDALDQDRWGLYLKALEADVLLFREENIELQVKEAQLALQYSELNGAMTVDFEGEERTMAQLSPFLEETDRDLRERAWRAGAERRYADRERLDSIFDDMVKLRGAMAHNADLEDYRAWAFKSMHRFDYGPAECSTFHDAIETVCVPLLHEMNEARREALGVDVLRPWISASMWKGEHHCDHSPSPKS